MEESEVNVTKTFLEWFTQIAPNILAPFAGTILGSGITLVATSLTNRANDRRLSRQLENDYKMKNREREMAFRKDIYTDAAKAIAISLGVLPKLSDLEVPLKEISSIYLEESPSLEKITL